MTKFQLLAPLLEGFPAIDVRKMAEEMYHTLSLTQSPLSLQVHNETGSAGLSGLSQLATLRSRSLKSCASCEGHNSQLFVVGLHHIALCVPLVRVQQTSSLQRAHPLIVRECCLD